MNQVHIVIGRRRRSYASMSAAITDVRVNLLCGVALSWIDRELLELCRAIFFVE